MLEKDIGDKLDRFVLVLQWSSGILAASVIPILAIGISEFFKAL